MNPRDAAGEEFGGLKARCGDWLRSVVCGLVNGHDLLVRFEPGRICLRCVSCTYETQGWQLKGDRPRPRETPRAAAVFAQHNAAQ